MKIHDSVKLPDDSIVSVKTRGLIGEKVLNVSLGGAPNSVAPGGVLMETESAADFEGLISKFVFGKV